MKIFDEEILNALIKRAQEQTRGTYSARRDDAEAAARWLKIVLQKQRALEKKRNKPKKGETPCEVCGGAEGVAWQEDPYNSDMYGDHTLHALCDDCVNMLAQEL